jgi:3',5'-cyclic AMP phosphodiesterase CpdA
VSYPPFHMNGQRYYSFAPPEDPLTRLTTRVEFFGLDSTNMDPAQLAWLDERLAVSNAEWKVVFLHHPLYTSGRYRNASRAHRWAIEPILTRHGVHIVLSGHEHIYQRTTLQQGVLYFVTPPRRRCGRAIHRAVVRPGLSLHADGDRARGDALPGGVTRGRDH